MSRTLVRFLADDSGQDLIEYALLVSLLAVVSIAALNAFNAKGRLFHIFDFITRKL